jgi:hypothetical protein
MKKIFEVPENLRWLDRINLLYGALGIFLFAMVATGSWKSFLVGWAIAVVNLELLKRLGILMIALYNGEKLGSSFYIVLFGKFLMWAAIISVFSLIKGLQPVPFMIGTATLVVAGLGFGVKEYFYARAS